jgi:hypothetical protein
MGLPQLPVGVDMRMLVALWQMGAMSKELAAAGKAAPVVR